MDTDSQKNHAGRRDTETQRSIQTEPPVEPPLEALIEQVIGAAIEVHRGLGPGFQEVTYHKALMIELDHCGITYESEVPVKSDYKGQPIGEGRVDLLVSRHLVVELKASEANPRAFSRQVASYLKASGLTIGLVINLQVSVLKDGLARVINR